MSRLLAALLALAPVGAAMAADPPLLRVLTETGLEQDGLPVYAEHPAAEPALAALSRGLSGEMLRIFALTQEYLRRAEGHSPQPAYLLLSSRQGGFPRYGFWLGDERMEEVGYVDLHRDRALTGRFGATDQLFPHELWHIIRRQVVGPQDEGFANQVHAVGVRTDRGVALNEGFAEAWQALALDHPDADPATRALASDEGALAYVEAEARAYAAELEARLALATRRRAGFILWFANGEDVLRYHGVRNNVWARQPDIPERLLDRDDPYAAYLYDSIVPADEADPLRSPARVLAIEGAMAGLAYAWASDAALQSYRPAADFYALFGTTAEQVSPVQNVWLKIIHAMYLRKAEDGAQLIDGYLQVFPEEAPALERLVSRLFGVPRLGSPPQLWLANEDFRTGTTVFDQFRGAPRTHTFDLNAASTIDLRSVPGVDLPLARRILAAAPYEAIGDLARVDGMSPDLLDRFGAMQQHMRQLLERAVDEEDSLSISAIVMPSVWRLLTALTGCAVLGAALYHEVRRRGPAPARPAWWRATVAGASASAVGIACGWAAGGLAGPGALAGVTLLFGLPAAAWCLLRRRGGRAAAQALLAWVAAALPAALAVTPLF